MTYSSSRPLPPMDCLIAALTALKMGSFSAAALELDVTHAAISRRIAVLENWVGESIFERHASGVKVTDVGQRVLARVEHALDQLEMAGAIPRKGKTLPIVRIAVTPSFARFWLIPRITKIEGSPKSLQLEIHASLSHADLLRGEVDLAIRYGRGNWKQGLEIKLFEETLVPVVPSNLLKDRRAISAKGLSQFPLLHSSDTVGWRTWARQYLSSLGSKSDDRVLADYSLSLEVAAAGLGVALWNTSIHDLTDVYDQLVPLTRFAFSSPLSYYLLSRENDKVSPPTVARSRIVELAKAP